MVFGYKGIILATLAACAVACNSGAKKESGGSAQVTTDQPAAAAKVDVAQARTIYNERCSACHGSNGRGDGPGATALTPKPRNYADRAWQKSVSDEQIRKAITYGGAAIGKSPMMPASPDLDAKPEIVDGLVKVVREFGG